MVRYALAVMLVVTSVALTTMPGECSETLIPSTSQSWPWKPIKPPAIPESHVFTHPIDQFIQAEQTSRKLISAPAASARNRLRRIYFDLIGLPPTPDQMQRFLQDSSPKAYHKAINDLLDNPAYGERWGRHWLDLVRYADTQGGALDYARPHMWRYRDYVIRAFNQDRPYDRFIREQLAADAFRVYGDEGKLGLGFLHQWVPVERDAPELNRRDFLNDVVGVTGSVFLGISLECARCHDHKYDPITARDYYQIEAFFAPLQVSKSSLPFGQYEAPNSHQQQWKERKNTWNALLDERKQLQNKTIEQFKQRILSSRSLSATGDLKDGVLPISDSQLRQVMEKGDLFSKDERQQYHLIRRQTARFANPNHPDYYEPMAYLASDSPLYHAVSTHILSGGNFRLPEDRVEPAFLSIITGKDQAIDLRGISGSRRKLLANWIASEDNPLTARVMVNRIWQYHFGRGLVSTTSDFGVNGSGTVYKDLVDWLANAFIESGWSVKSIHRLILTSHAYQQSMNHPRKEAFEKLDPDNRFLWVRDPIRIQAEVLRDTVLATSGRLNRTMGGPPFFPSVDDELMQRAPTWWAPSSQQQRDRRTIYMLQIRSLQHPFIKVFDGPNIDESCPVREVTTVTPQVFALFNSYFLHDQSISMAKRIADVAGNDCRQQVIQGFQFALQRNPTNKELTTCTAFLQTPVSESSDSQTVNESADKLADLCLVLMNSNEFVFLE